MDKLHKARLYLTSEPDYWTLPAKGSLPEEILIGYYPVSFRKRLYQGHYRFFDSDGIPMFHSKKGNLVHFISGMCSFSFACWEEFLLTGDSAFAEKLVKVADYILTLGVQCANGAVMIYDFDSELRDNGIACAMNQGECISVFCRAYSYTGDNKYLESAKKLAIPFKHEYGNEGVADSIPGVCEKWYLEGGKRILNGHIYSIFGLYELHSITKDELTGTCISEGINSIIKALKFFDTGYWSLYWLESKKYIASAMYHNLHIVQLHALYELTGEEIFLHYSYRFLDYYSSPLNRFRAGFSLFSSKVKRIFNYE